LRDTQQPLLAICVGPILERVLAQAPAAGSAALPDQAPAAGAQAPAAGSAALPDQAPAAGAPAPAAGAALHAAYPSPAPSTDTTISLAPKKGSQTVRAAVAVRAKVRP
jgi:hypothetical protein